MYLAGQQPATQGDTIETEKGSRHLFLNLDIPEGDLTFKKSHMCGSTHFSVYNPKNDMVPLWKSYQHKNNNLTHNFSLALGEELQAKSVKTKVVASGFEPMFFDNKNEKQGAIHTFFGSDPSIPADIKLNIGYGDARINLSEMMTNQIEVVSQFADVFLLYTRPNRMPMEKMEVKSVQGKIVLKNIELARAHLITVTNDMNQTKIMVGNGEGSGTTILVQQGVGDCMLFLHPDHPIRLMVKEGFFASASLPKDFIKLSENEFVNKAWKAQEAARGTVKGTTIICTLDMGKLQVSSM